MKDPVRLLLAFILFISACTSSNKKAESSSASMPADSVVAIAKRAYVYGIPLVLMDITRGKLTNVEVPIEGKAAPINQIVIFTKFPDAKFRDVVKPNADTYYTIAFLDLSNEPLVLTVPNTNGRYYLLPMLDAYTNVFVSPGKRTTGTEAATYLISGPSWSGTVPSEMKEIKAPTNLVWMAGRTQVNSMEDGEKVVVPIEKGYTLTPLSAWGTPYTAPKGMVNPDLSKATPNMQIESLSIDSFFNYINRLMVKNPPAVADSNAMKMFSKIGVAPGARFILSAFDTTTQSALRAIPAATFKQFAATRAKGAVKPVNGWVIFMKGVGNYGTNYELRAMVAYMGLGANLPEDAVYPSCSVDADGNPFSGANKYVIHFDAGKTPPVNAFWSLTMYDQDGYFIENPINRYAIGDRNPLKKNADGSIDIYFQNQSPEKDKESNWLPAPIGSFNLLLRMYWPKEEMLNGSWTPPPVMKVK